MPIVLRIICAVLIGPIRLPGYPVGMILVKEVGIVLMPPVGVLPVAFVVVVAILRTPYRVHNGPFWMVGVEPFDIVSMPPSRAMPDLITIIRAPAGFAGSAIVSLSRIAFSRIA